MKGFPCIQECGEGGSLYDRDNGIFLQDIRLAVCIQRGWHWSRTWKGALLREWSS